MIGFIMQNKILVSVTTAAFLAMGFMTYTVVQQNKEIASLEKANDEAKVEMVNLKQELADSSEKFDKKKHQKQVKERTISAQKIGKEMIAIDDELTTFYKTSDPLPKDKKAKDAIFKKLEAAKRENTRITGASEADHIQTWQLNPDWTLKLETIVAYRDTDRVPILFSMTTKKGKPAGLISATYDVSNHMIDDVARHYTIDGLKDEVDVGGM